MAKRPRNRKSEKPSQGESSWRLTGFQTRAYYAPSIEVVTSQGDRVRILDPKKAGQLKRHEYRRQPVETGGLHYHKPPPVRKPRQPKARGPEYARVLAEQEELAYRHRLVERAREAARVKKAKADGRQVIEESTLGDMAPARKRQVYDGFKKAGMAHLIK